MTANVRLVANDPLLAHGIESLAEKLRDEGYEVEVLAELRESRGLPRELVEPLLWIFVGAAFDQDIYPRVKRCLSDWFMEQPKPVRRRLLRVHLYDQDEKPVESISLQDRELDE